MGCCNPRKKSSIKSFFCASPVDKGKIMILPARARLFLLCLCVVTLGLPVFAQSGSQGKTPQSWMNSSLSPDERADMVVKEMTLDEKVTLLHGTGHPGLGPMSPLSSASNGGAGYVVGI